MLISDKALKKIARISSPFAVSFGPQLLHETIQQRSNPGYDDPSDSSPGGRCPFRLPPSHHFRASATGARSPSSLPTSTSIFRKPHPHSDAGWTSFQRFQEECCIDILFPQPPLCPYEQRPCGCASAPHQRRLFPLHDHTADTASSPTTARF